MSFKPYAISDFHYYELQFFMSEIFIIELL